MTKNGPTVSECIFMGSTETKLDDKIINLIKDGNLDALGNGEINVDLALQQSGNSVFITNDEFLSHLKECKKAYPEIPLNFLIDTVMP